MKEDRVAKELITMNLESSLVQEFDDYVREHGDKSQGKPSRTGECRIAWKNHISDKELKVEEQDVLSEYRIDLADKYCQLHNIAIMNNQVISIIKGKEISPGVQVMHLDTVKLISGDLMA